MNELRSFVPPTFSERAHRSNFQKPYNLNIPLMYSNKNPSWQQLTINEADALDGDITMQRLDANELFAPRIDDVRMLEREVNVYRARLQDDELQSMQDERSRLVQMLNEQENDDLDDRLFDLNNRIEQRQQQIREVDMRTRQLEEDNRLLEQELNMRVMPLGQPANTAPHHPQQQQLAQSQLNKSQSGKNLLPNKIATLPQQVQARNAYNYKEGDNPGYQAPHLSDPDFRKQAGLPSQPNQQQQYNPSSPLQPQQSPQPYQSAGNRPSIPMPMPVNNSNFRPQQPQSPMIQPSLQMQQQPTMRGGVQAVPFGNTGMTVSPTPSGMGGQNGGQARFSGATYKINGMTFTDATLPPQYAHLRR